MKTISDCKCKSILEEEKKLLDVIDSLAQQATKLFLETEVIRSKLYMLEASHDHACK